MTSLDQFRGKHSAKRSLIPLGMGIAALGAVVMVTGSIVTIVAGCLGVVSPWWLPWATMSGGLPAFFVGTGAFAWLTYRPLRMFCAQCGMYVPSDVAWTCGYCGHTHEGHRFWYSFLNKCEKCGESPKGFKCPHRGCDLFGEENSDKARWAYKVTDTAPKPISGWKKEEEGYLEHQKRLGYQKNIAVLERDLAKVTRPEPPADPLNEDILKMEKECLSLATLQAALKRCRKQLDGLEICGAEKERIIARLKTQFLEKK